MADARDFNLASDNVWALDATAAAGAPATPAQGTAYRNTTADFSAGFQYLSKSPSEVANEFLNLASKNILQLQTNGTLGWMAATTYPQGAICHGSNNLTYVSLQNANVGQDPTTQTSWWQVIYNSGGPYSNAAEWTTNTITIFGITLKWGYTANLASSGTKSVTFGTPFSNFCMNLQLTVTNTTGSNQKNNWAQIQSMATTGFTFVNQCSDVEAGGGYVYWFAVGV